MTLVLALGLAAGLAGQEIAVGQLLVATRQLRDPFFQKSVILVVYVGENGVIGLMLNQSLECPVSEILPGAKAGGETAQAGGPVPMGIFALVRAYTPLPDSQQILPRLFMVADRKRVAKLEPSPNMRIYGGNCGWSAAQLKNELRMGFWRVLSGRADTVFDKSPETLWERLISAMYARIPQPERAFALVKYGS